jgi:hypothetical protein
MHVPPEHTVTEAAMTATISVTRAGGSLGAASVDYSTADGTATGGGECGPGIDYVSTSGTLTWADGDAAAKAFTVTVCADSTSEPNEALNLALSNVTGAALASPSTAVFTIINSETFSGPVNVGAGEAYTSLTNAGGIFQAINNGSVTGNVVVNITSDLTGETGAIGLNEMAGGFSVTIKLSGAARTVTSTSTALNLIVLTEPTT